MSELNQIMNQLYSEIMDDLLYYSSDPSDLLVRLSLEFVNIMISFVEMNESTAKLLVKLCRLVVKREKYDKVYMAATIKHMSSRKGQWYYNIRDALNQLIMSK